MSRKISLLFVWLMLLVIQSYSQDPVLPAIIPSSPESESLCRAGLLSNNLYTGTASFSIPLYELSLKTLKLPIGLQYSSNGVRNSDLPGSVGMNFNLLAGGRIMRIIHDESDGAPENEPWIDPFPNPYYHNADLLYYLNEAADYYWDTEPDEYIYNFNGMSGRFFVDSSGIGRCIPENNLKIEVFGADEDQKSFTITTPDGTVYSFNGVAELTNSFQLYGTHSYSTSYNNETAWFLTDVTTQAGEWLSFQYTAASVTVAPGTHSVSYSSSNSSGCSGNYCPTETYNEPNFLHHDTWYVSAITASNGLKVDFTYENRPDYSLSGDKRLTNILVSESLSGSARAIKKYAFKYSNYRCYDSWQTNSCWFFLDTLVNESIDGSGLTEKHSFEYYGKSYLWNRTYPYDWDVMGYFHGGGYYPIDWTHIDTAATRLYYQTLGVEPNHWKYPDPTQMPAGMLTQVNFPTGGYQKFYYEPHITSGGIFPGGVRVKQIDNYDPLSGVTSRKFYKYTSLSDTTASSGFNSYEPFYGTSYNYGFVCGTTIQECPSTITSDNSLTPFSLSKGSNVTYSTVIESDDANLANGGIEHSFYNWPGSSYGNAWPELGDFFTLPPSNTEPDLNGTEIKTVFFKKKDTTWITLKQVENSFTEDKRNQKTRPGFITRRRYKWPYGFNPPQSFEFEGYDLIPYKYKSFKYNLTKTVTTSYDEKGQNAVIDSVKYEYKDSVGGQPTKITSRASDTANVVLYNWYAKQLDNGSNIYANMVSKHMIGMPVESKTYRNGSLVAAQKTVLNNNFGGSIIYPEQVQTKLMPDTTNYKTRTHFYAYGAGGAPKEMAKENDVHQCYIYGYTSDSNVPDNLPIAEVTNATASNVAYTSFEVGSKGGWTYSGTPQVNPASVTGDRCYNLSSGNITKTISSGTTYIVTFWLKNSTGTASVNSSSATSVINKNGWTLYTKTISGASTITVSGTGKIDELRLYPRGAMMRTMTYRPFIGISSECDVNNRIIYYTYDGFGRLILVRDEDRNVLKKNCYTYKGQTENCNLYGNVQKSGSFNKATCTGDSVGNAATYTVAANTYYSTTQALADALAQADVDANGQDYANNNGTCSHIIYYNAERTVHWIKDDCMGDSSGTMVPYTIPANTYSSTISQAYVDSLANDACYAGGQANANLYGSCISNNITLYYTTYSYLYYPIYFTFTNLDTYEEYEFETTPYAYPYSPIELGQLPPGYYDVEIFNPYSYSYHYYDIGCYDYAYGSYYAYAYWVYLDEYCNTIDLNY